jgi:predicted DNA-binding transcriptional regulator AlpA
MIASQASEDAYANRVVSEPEAAKFLGLSKAQLRVMRRAGKAPEHVRLSERRLGYRLSALDCWLNARTIKPLPAGGRGQ